MLCQSPSQFPKAQADICKLLVLSDEQSQTQKQSVYTQIVTKKAICIRRPEL